MELDGKRGRVPERRVGSQPTFLEVCKSRYLGRRRTLGAMVASSGFANRPSGARCALLQGTEA
jgi:hypothetical protein